MTTTPHELLEIARKTGLRQFLHGVDATTARELLAAFVAALPVAELTDAQRHTYASIANGMTGQHRDTSGTEYVTLADAEAAVRATKAAQAAPSVPTDEAAFDTWFTQHDEPNKCCQEAWKEGRASKAAPSAKAEPDAEHVARLVTNEDKAALLKIIAELGWEINGAWVVTKSDDKMHTLDALAFARTVHAVVTAPAPAVQAEDARNRVLEEAAVACDKRRYEAAAQVIRALRTPSTSQTSEQQGGAA